MSCLSARVALLAHVQLMRTRRDGDGEILCVLNTTAWGVKFPADEGVRRA
jgi:hypothetical protein